jgi:hypothetical protein
LTVAEKKRGRPKIEFDLTELEKLAALQCTDEELAAWFECSVDTIQRRRKEDEAFLRSYQKGREGGKISLRRLQWKTAQGGHAGMQIWLGKNWTDQRDRSDLDVTQVGTPELNVILSAEGADDPESETP